jgi:hypothetical protein
MGQKYVLSSTEGPKLRAARTPRILGNQRTNSMIGPVQRPFTSFAIKIPLVVRILVVWCGQLPSYFGQNRKFPRIK